MLTFLFLSLNNYELKIFTRLSCTSDLEKYFIDLIAECSHEKLNQVKHLFFRQSFSIFHGWNEHFCTCIVSVTCQIFNKRKFFSKHEKRIRNYFIVYAYVCICVCLPAFVCVRVGMCVSVRVLLVYVRACVCARTSLCRSMQNRKRKCCMLVCALKCVVHMRMCTCNCMWLCICLRVLCMCMYVLVCVRSCIMCVRV